MRRALFALTALVLSAGWAQDASSQCSITRLDINGTATLCSDFGDDWRWTGPNGFTSSAMCIDAVQDGLYTLRVFDAATGTWSEPCSQQVGDPAPPPGCSISGPDSVCAGESVTWCAPSGEFTFAWSGPNGFASSGACITVSTPGTYTLSVSDANGTGEPCSQTLRVVDCTPLETVQECPAPARWWASACDNTQLGMDPVRMDQIASGVDQRSAVWNFGGTRAGFKALVSPVRHGRPYAAARRHYAAVIANLVASDMDVIDGNGRTIGLDADMLLDGISGVAPGTTLAAWVAATEAALSGLDENACRQSGARETARRIRAEAREINSGARQGGCGLSHALLADDDDEELFGSASMTLGGQATPFSGAGSTRMRFTLERADDVELDVIDLSGRRVKVLARGTVPAGTHEWSWDGRSDAGQVMRPGAYFLSGRIGGVRMTQRLMLIR